MPYNPVICVISKNKETENPIRTIRFKVIVFEKKYFTYTPNGRKINTLNKDEKNALWRRIFIYIAGGKTLIFPDDKIYKNKKNDFKCNTVDTVISLALR